jgi:hypothetical protein
MIRARLKEEQRALWMNFLARADCPELWEMEHARESGRIGLGDDLC